MGRLSLSRSSFRISSPRALAMMAVLAVACSEASDEYDREPPLIEPSVPTNQTDQCAPPSAAQVTSGDTVYYRYASAKNWNAAKSDCEAMGGRLAVPMNQSANDTIRNMNGGQKLHVGIYQPNNQANPGAGWLTVEGAASGFFKWRPGEPNDSPDAPENNQENCVEMHLDGTWNDEGCTNANRQYVCEFGSAPVACGGGSSCTIPSGETTYSCTCPSGQSYDAANNVCYGGPLAIEVNRLEVDRGYNLPAFVNFPIHAKVGLKGTGNTNNIMVTLGLAEKPPSGANATNEELANLHTCQLGGEKITLKGDGTQQYVEFDSIVPPECLGTDPLRVYNFYVMLDGAQDVSTETDKWLVYNLKEQSTAIAQKCKTPDPMTGTDRAGCVIDLQVRPSPGLDLAFLSVAPQSSVIVLDPSGQHGSVPSGQTEAPRPLVTVDSSITAFGRDYDTSGAATMPGAVGFNYSIIATPDNGSVGWKPLNFNTDAGATSISTLKPGEKLEIEGRLHPTPEFRTLTSPGGPWAGITDYKIRGCVGAPFQEMGDPAAAGMNGLNNNCREFTVHLVFGSFDATAASSQDETKTISESYGSSSTLALALTGGSTNSFNLSGASSSNYAKATMSGFFGSFDVFHAWGNGSASVSTLKGDIDYGLKIFGVSLLSDNTGASASASLSTNYSQSKEKCVTYSYGVVIVSIDLSGCFSASAGVSFTLTATGTAVTANVRPYASVSLSVSASLNVTLYKASLTGSLTILGINTSSSDGVTASLSYTINQTSPSVKLTIGFTINATFKVSTLSGSLEVTLEQLEVNWCKKKIGFIKVYYPCWSYDTVAEYTIASFTGYSYTYSLLARTGSSIVLQ